MSFWELALTAVVALIVLGPERLPGAIRSVHKTIRSIKSFSQQMQAELNENLRVHELHQKLKQAEDKGFLNLTEEEKTVLTELKQAAADVNTPLSSTTTDSITKDDHKTRSE